MTVPTSGTEREKRTVTGGGGGAVHTTGIPGANHVTCLLEEGSGTGTSVEQRQCCEIPGTKLCDGANPAAIM